VVISRTTLMTLIFFAAVKTIELDGAHPLPEGEAVVAAAAGVDERLPAGSPARSCRPLGDRRTALLPWNGQVSNLVSNLPYFGGGPGAADTFAHGYHLLYEC